MVSALVSKVNKVLGESLKEFRSGLEHGTRNDRITGYVVSSDFVGLDHSGRQKKLWALLESRLSKDDLVRIGPIVTMTPSDADIGEPEPVLPSRPSNGKAS